MLLQTTKMMRSPFQELLIRRYKLLSLPETKQVIEIVLDIGYTFINVMDKEITSKIREYFKGLGCEIEKIEN